MALSTADGSRSECDAEVLERGGGASSDCLSAAALRVLG